MIFKFSVNGKEDRMQEFEKELMDILNKSIEDNEIAAQEIHFCVHEAILNIVQHSYNWDVEKPIDVRLNISVRNEKTKIEFHIQDRGPALEKELLPPKKIDPFQPRQRGLYMINKIMDEVKIQPKNGKGNLTFMKKEIDNLKR